MACSACAGKVEKEAMKINGVKAAKVDQPKGTAQVTFDARKTSPGAIAKAITDRTGFQCLSTSVAVGTVGVQLQRRGLVRQTRVSRACVHSLLRDDNRPCGLSIS
jgi:copper chaperone CopZ